jgi:Family of unknown function (DUF6659)
MMSNQDFEALCEKIFSISPNIRFAGVVTSMGSLVSGGMRKGLNSLEAKDDSSKLYIEFALISGISKDYDSTFGKAIYSFAEREKIKLASFPLSDNYILQISINKEERNHMKIIEDIVNIIREQYQYQK